ncbi:hypothetical protein F0310_04020 [Borrelia sp. A-FGy1]|uniref:hypothetical protein n=1 Tax=Borrelia sp. A-FGy1 TaxID=2608247 RepID=UPI0015F6ECD9|nr:hypothetical protein [Borrelia sp. A-FGy1]QMU99549.1 hypothetical protein F0310_04020 [Borrelia sp. A-FGy1]
MKFILKIVYINRLIFLNLFLLFSCLSITEEDFSLPFSSFKEEKTYDEGEIGNEGRGHLLGLQDDESFFLSDAFLKEDNFYFISARESYAKKDFGMTNFYLNKILTNEKSYSRELLSKANLFLGYLNYNKGEYSLSEYNFDCFLRYYKYSHASLRVSELKYFAKDRMGAISALRDIDESSIILDYDRGIYNFLNNKFGVNYLNLEALGFIDNSVFDMFILGNNVFVSNIFGGLLRYNVKNNNYRIYIKDKKSIELNGLRGFAEYKGAVYIGGNNVLYYVDDFEGFVKQVNVPLRVKLGNIQTLIGVKDGIFIGTLESGLWFYSDLDNWIHIKLGSNKISSVYLDKEKNILFVGTMDSSIYTINLDDFRDIKHLNFFSKEKSEKNINFIKRYNNYYYVGTYGGGLFRLNLEDETYIKYKVGNDFSIEYFLDMEVRGNKLLFATFEYGLLIYNTINNSWDYLGPYDGLLNLNLVKVLSFNNYIILGTLNNGLVFVDESIKKQL